jgi:all-trans-retinol 13,14-reductase
MSNASFFLHATFALPGGYYPVGGSSELAFNIIPVIEESGGKVMTRAIVKEILIDEHGRAYGQLQSLLC